MPVTINFKRGLKSALPSSGMTAYEPILATDTHEMFVATGTTTTAPVVPAISDLTDLGTQPASGDLFIVYDIDEAGSVKAKKVSMADLGVSDMQVAVDSGASPGYLGAAYNDGVLRVDNASLGYADGGDYITLSLDSTLKTNYDAAYTHSGLTSGNPHNVTKSDVSLGNVENTALSTWTGSSSIVTIGTLTNGVIDGGTF